MFLGILNLRNHLVLKSPLQDGTMWRNFIHPTEREGEGDHEDTHSSRLSSLLSYSSNFILSYSLVTPFGWITHLPCILSKIYITVSLTRCALDMQDISLELSFNARAVPDATLPAQPFMLSLQRHGASQRLAAQVWVPPNISMCQGRF